MDNSRDDSLPKYVGLDGLAARENMSFRPNLTDKQEVSSGFVNLVDVMGNDLTVVNAARVSFGKRSESLEDRDKRLISYLLRHEHTSPFRHGFFTFHIKAPIFVLRQWGKHQVGCSWNEISLRYIKHNMGFWSPSSWRGKPADSVKQGSGATIDNQDKAQEVYCEALATAEQAYNKLIDLGVCNEQARAILPMSLMTEFWWTASLQAVLRFLDLRLAKDAQSEIRDYAQAVENIVSSHYPAVLEAWRLHAK